METNKTLAEDFGGERVVSNGYGGFMEGLLQLVEGKEISAPLGEQIKAYAWDLWRNTTWAGLTGFRTKRM
ncbi:hypothetical protein DXA95_11410 [Odoribacter sp. OF09-27XD]|nr:hypothetical protein [Odoribacter sp. OF09-27XD]RHV92963.1 hypothetical protein DXA95_11410 [Odoribacter sp. OF09-27XD]